MGFIGLGTVINVATIIVGSLLGLALGSRLDERTRTTITHVLALCTLVMGATTMIRSSVTGWWPMRSVRPGTAAVTGGVWWICAANR